MNFNILKCLIFLNLGMKESDYLKQLYDKTENDTKAWAIIKQIKRAEKQEAFELRYLPHFKSKFGKNVWYDEKGAYIIKVFNEELKKDILMDYYPKADKLLIRHQNKWIQNGINWIIRRYFRDVDFTEVFTFE